MRRSLFLLLLIIALGAFLRLYNLNWDEGHYLHPDERLYIQILHMPSSWEEFFSPDSPLNPKMFYYGPFPLYIYTIVYSLFPSSFSFLLVSRGVSALFSILTIPVLYAVGKRISSEKLGLLTAFIFAVTPTSIQHAHFNTTESILVFLLSLIVYYSIRLVQTKNIHIVGPLGILMSCAFATKITALTFGLIPLTAVAYILLSTRKYIPILAACCMYGILAILVGLLLTPYNWIDFKTFYEQQHFMQGVILGTNKPPFVIIYEGTLPYLYPLLQILPFSFGFFAFSLGLIGLGVMVRSLFKDKAIKYKAERIAVGMLLVVFPLIYFLWSGTWYSKFSRYYIFLLPFFCLYAAFFLTRINPYARKILAVLMLFNALLFFRIYLSPHTRVAASEWIYQNTPATTTISFEHWDDPLPLPLQNYPSRHEYLKELQVYNEPDSPEKINDLTTTVSSSDYIVFSSRRVYASILMNKNKYPFTSSFYEQLFTGNLGFKLEKRFTSYPYFFSDDIADESFQSYDHPPVVVFRKYQTLTAEELQARIIGNAKRTSGNHVERPF